MDIGAALTDPRVLQPFFAGASWDAWRAVLRGAFGERMTKAERKSFREVTDREPPGERAKEVWIIAGRRCGKDSTASGVVTHIAASFEPAGRLRPGERALVALLACDRAQAQTVLGYTRAFFENVPALAALVRRATGDGFELTNSVDIAIATNDFRAVRGRTILACVLDEVSFWSGETAASPDTEVYRALRPGMATLSELMLIGITTAYRRSGLAYERWQRHFGRDGKVLVVRAPSTALNPLLPQSEIDDAMAEDAAAAAADYLSEWRDDLASYVSRDLVESAVDNGVTVRPPDVRHRYTSFIDASSGQANSFTAAVTHREGDIAILDNLIEVKAPFNTTDATAQIAAVLKAYGLRDTMGDNFAAGWVEREFARHAIAFKPRPTGMDRSALYLETLPLFSAGRVRLLDNKQLVAQYAALERRVMPGGRDRVDHPNRSGHHDDASNACSGALWRVTAEAPPMRITPDMLGQIAALGRHGNMGRREAAAQFQLGERQIAQLAYMRSRRFV